MPASLQWLIALGPIALALPGLVPGRAADRRPAAMATVAAVAALVALGALALAAASVAIHGELRTRVLGLHGVGLGFYADALSTTMALLVAFIGLIVVRYSRNYLHGDPGQGRFLKWLCLTLSAVILVIVSGNLLQFALAWVLTSVGLHRLLIFYADRPAAVLAARKKFVASRLGDLSLVVAMLLLYRCLGTLDYAELLARAASISAGTPSATTVHAAALLLVVAALLKSAQFPLHGWLIEVMETPTPVSALLHAGIINAGGFLVLRFAGLISLSPTALGLLAAVGAITALFGSLVMLTQTSIKVSLAYSTIGQMGFMMLECGLGAFSAALLHIVGHSLYKAHAFLSCGSVVEIARGSWTPTPGNRPHPGRWAVASGLFAGATLLVCALYGARVAARPDLFVLGAILLLGLAHLLASAVDERPIAYVIGRTLGAAVLLAIGFAVLHALAARVLAGTLPAGAPLQGPSGALLVAAVLASFAAVVLLQNALPSYSSTPRWQALYVHAANGFYLNTLTNRLALRFWPGPAPAPAARAVTTAPHQGAWR